MTHSATGAALFAAYFAALYAAHHVGDYWVQTNHQATHKGLPGWPGRLACLGHVGTYVVTQLVSVWIVKVALGLPGVGWGSLIGALLVSGVTHYVADRRKPLERLARLLDRTHGKLTFYRLGTPRQRELVARSTEDKGLDWVPLDQPTLGTGAWALDQSFHIALSVFVPALILAL